MINNKTIMIIGATGSFGQNLLNQYLKNLNLKKFCYSRDEANNLKCLMIFF